MNFWTGITHFGDIAITAPLALAIAGWLTVEDEKKLAFRWCLLFGLGTALVVATKMAFIGWGLGIHAIDFTGFSGHAMRSAAIMPVLFYLLMQKMNPVVRVAAALAGGAFAVLIGVSRLAVQAHSVSEVIAGWMLGALVAITFLRVANSTLRQHVFKPWRSALVILALLPAPYVHPTPTQKWLTEFTFYFAGHQPNETWLQLRRNHASQNRHAKPARRAAATNVPAA